MTSDVRCFLVPHESGLLLVDAGLPGSEAALVAALAQIGASWGDVTDVVLTHEHFDHTGGLPQVLAAAPASRVFAGAAVVSAMSAAGRPVVALKDGDHIRTLTVLATPGHTRGHLSLLVEHTSLLLSVTWSAPRPGRSRGRRQPSLRIPQLLSRACAGSPHSMSIGSCSPMVRSTQTSLPPSRPSSLTHRAFIQALWLSATFDSCGPTSSDEGTRSDSLGEEPEKGCA